uniref:Uncharacterized protein n=1 Tax=Anguilla anguilla TaxID=7936 RepID=A0A0E9R4F0_ANGAN
MLHLPLLFGWLLQSSNCIKFTRSTSYVTANLQVTALIYNS